MSLKTFMSLGIFAFGIVSFGSSNIGHDPIYSSKFHAKRPENLRIYYPNVNVNKSEDTQFNDFLLDNVQPERLKNRVTALSGIKRRDIRSEGILEATEYLVNEFTQIGFAPQKDCFQKNGVGDICNVIAEKIGSSGDVVYVVAHFDSVGHKYAGADDNASGVAGLLEIAQILKEKTTEHSVVFAAVNAEETGLHGSRAIANRLVELGKTQNVRTVVVMDMIGVNMGDKLDLETYEAYRDLGQEFIDDIAVATELKTRLIIPGWGSDHIPFLKKGMPAFLSISDTNAGTPCYHRKCDKPDTIDYDFFVKMVKANLLMTIKMAEVR